MTIKELLEDLLIEFDELDMQPMLTVPNPLDRAKAWKHELTYAIKHLEAEVAREIFEEIDAIIFGTIIPNDCAIISIAKLAELKKKYTEEKT